MGITTTQTYWARTDADGPWFESELRVGSSSFELRPTGPTGTTTSLAYDAVERIDEPTPVTDPAERTVEVLTTEGRALAVSGPAAGIEALQTSIRHHRLGPRPAGGSARRPLTVMAAVVGAAVLLVGLWSYHADRHELAAKARRRHGAAASSTTSTEPPRPEASVEGTSTIPSPTTTAPRPVTTAPPPAGPTTTTTTLPHTSTTAAAQPFVSAAAAPPTTAVHGAAPTTAASVHTFVGTVTLRQAQRTDDGTVPVCAGVGALQDITTGTTVTVRDPAGHPVATGALGTCRLVPPDSAGIPGGPPPGSAGTPSVVPQFDLSVPDVPDADGYTLQVSHYAPVTFTRAQLGAAAVWKVRIAVWL